MLFLICAMVYSSWATFSLEIKHTFLSDVSEVKCTKSVTVFHLDATFPFQAQKSFTKSAVI